MLHLVAPTKLDFHPGGGVRMVAYAKETLDRLPALHTSDSTQTRVGGLVYTMCTVSFFHPSRSRLRSLRVIFAFCELHAVSNTHFKLAGRAFPLWEDAFSYQRRESLFVRTADY